MFPDSFRVGMITESSGGREDSEWCPGEKSGSLPGGTTKYSPDGNPDARDPFRDPFSVIVTSSHPFVVKERLTDRETA
jgi:hypothetical protein